MDFGLGTYLLGFAAGALSLLSPCVLPVAPIVLASATAAHRWGALALTTGITLSFTAVGLFVATIGVSIGLSTEAMRVLGAGLLVGAGALLLLGSLQARFAAATAGVGNAAQNLLLKWQPTGLHGQFITGVLLGIVWTPCVGPTLGAATVLAAQGKDLGSIAVLMVAFALGTSIPLVALGQISRKTFSRFRNRITRTGARVKQMLGAVMVGLGLLVAFGADKRLEATLLDLWPETLNELSTRF